MRDFFWVGLFEGGTDAVEVGSCLSESDPRFEAAKHFKDAFGVGACVEEVLAVHLLLVDDRHEEVRNAEQQRPRKAARGDADDGEGMAPEQDSTTDDVGILVKTSVPAGPGEHDVGRAAGAVLVGGVKNAAEERLNADEVEVISAGGITGGADRIVAGIECGEDHLPRGETLEGVVAIAEVAVVGQGVEMLDGPEALRLRHAERAQNECVENAKDDGVGADCEGQRGNGGESEAR